MRPGNDHNHIPGIPEAENSLTLVRFSVQE